MDEPAPDAPHDDARHELTPRQADTFVVAWTSFLAACLGTMLLFAWIDPVQLADVAELPLPSNRMTGYAVGFFFLWVICLLAAALCAWLLRTQHVHPAPQTDRQ